MVVRIMEYECARSVEDNSAKLIINNDNIEVDIHVYLQCTRQQTWTNQINMCNSQIKYANYNV